MEFKDTYEKYPISYVLTFCLVTLSIYLVGMGLFYAINPWLGLVFLVYALYTEAKIWRDGCTNCYYYGKRCICARGLIAPLLFKKGDPKKFTAREMTMKDMIPNFMVAIFPVLAGAYLLWQQFSIALLAVAIWPIFVMFVGNSVIYGKLACPHCKQGETGCPACEFFSKREKKK